MQRLTTIIAEDEPLARKKLARLINAVPWLDLVAQVADGNALRQQLDAIEPDIAFVDIQMPGISGLQALTAARHRPRVIFTTAFDQHAVAAFELGAVDYLLKPFGKARFTKALTRLQVGHDVMSDVARLALTGGEGALETVFVRVGARIVQVHLDEVDWIAADGEYIRLHSAGREYLIKQPLHAMLQRLDRERFVQIHRSRIVNLKRVTECVSTGDGRLVVKLCCDAEVRSSRSGAREMRKRWSGD